ncbi:MFS transporter [Brevibacterium litoralis]|uniref:MFS transporter n=1 Tax=Brevibacterium litoralis TaxID=3138935 RepID=UPI0032ECE522
MSEKSVDKGGGKLPGSFVVWVVFTALSMFGVQIVSFSMGWAASAHGPAVAGIVLTATVLPRALLLLVGGAVADRVGAWKMLVIGDSVMLAAVLALFGATLHWGTPAVLLVLMSLVIGTVDAFYIPASGSLPRRMLTREQLPRGMSMRQIGYQLAGVLGAPVAGVVFGSFGLAGSALINVITFGVMLVVLLLLRNAVGSVPERRPENSQTSILTEVGDGLRVVWTDRLLRDAVLLVTATTALLLPIVPLLIPVLGRESGWTSQTTGIAVGAFGVGTAIVAVLVLTRGALPRPGVVAGLGPALAALGAVALALPTDSLMVPVVGAFVIGLGTGLFSTHVGPLLLGGAPREFISRVQSIVALAQSLPLVLANAGLGFLAEAVGVRTVLVGVAIGLAIVTCGAVSSASLRAVGRTEN